jgi:hypothetical protein
MMKVTYLANGLQERKPNRLKLKFFLVMKDNHDSMKLYAEMARKIKKEPNISAVFEFINTDDNPTTALAIAATTNVLATSSILQAPEPVIQSLSLEAIQAEMQTEFRAAAQGLHENITSEVEPAEVRTGLGLGTISLTA